MINPSIHSHSSKLSGNIAIATGSLTVGTDGLGQDVILHSGTAGDNFTWDASEEKLTITGTNGATALDVADGNVTIADDLAVTGELKSYIALNEITSTTYTFVLADAGKLVTSSNGSDQTLTVPANSAQAFPVGTQINVLRKGTGNTTIATAGTPTLSAADGALVLRVRYSSCTLIKVATDLWYVVGDLTT